jgi:hypothetical protein
MVSLDSACGSVNQNYILGIMKNLDPKYLVILGLFLYVLFLQNCSDQRTNDEVVTVTTDTLRTTFVDTVLFIDTVVHTMVITINDPLIVNDSVKEYTNDFTDSLLIGSVWTQVEGSMLNQKIDYTPKFPQYIFQIDTVIINTNQTTIRQESKFSLDIGIEVGGNTNEFNFSPILGFSNKNQNSYFYRYGLIDKTHNVGIMYKIKL